MTLTSDSLLQVPNSSFETQDIEWKRYWLFCGCVMAGVALNIQGFPSLQRPRRSPQTCGSSANSNLRDSLVLNLSTGFSCPSHSVKETASSLRCFLTLCHKKPEVLLVGELSKQWKGASAPRDCSNVTSRLQQPHSTAAASHIPQVLPIKLVIAYNGVSWILHASKSHIIWLWGLKRRLGGGRDAVGLGAGVSTQSRAARPIHSPWPPPTQHSW